MHVQTLIITQKTSLANDTVATVSSEEIIFTSTPEISLEEEILEICEDKIKVNYLFKNHTDKEITKTIAFPLPPTPVKSSIYPSWDESFIAQEFLDNNPAAFKENSEALKNFYNMPLKRNVDRAPFLNFKRSVNDSEYGYQYRIIAKTKDGRDITYLLKQNNIPISAAYLIGYETAGALEKDPPLKAKLKKLKLLDENEKPVWQTQTVYYWEQTFPANQTIRVSHEYTPHTGSLWLDAKNTTNQTDKKIEKIEKLEDIKFYSRDDSQKWEDYTVSDDLKKRLFNYLQKYETIPAREVDYILTTANSWRGPIKKFRLEIHTKSNFTIPAFIWPAKVFQVKEGVYVSELQNFTPKSELKILFLNFREL